MLLQCKTAAFTPQNLCFSPQKAQKKPLERGIFASYSHASASKKLCFGGGIAKSKCKDICILRNRMLTDTAVSFTPCKPEKAQK